MKDVGVYCRDEEVGARIEGIGGNVEKSCQILRTLNMLIPRSLNLYNVVGFTEVGFYTCFYGLLDGVYGID